MAERIESLRNAWSPADPQALDALLEADVERLRLLSDSSNYVFLADLVHPEHGTGLGVYKPQRGERPLSDFPYGTLHTREVAAYELARLLGWALVPPTVEREGPEGLGSLQLFIPHDPNEHYFELRARPGLHDQLVRLAVFDLVANNADRKGGHMLLDAAGSIWAIDNALSFHHHPKVRTVIWDFAGEAAPDPLLADLRRVRDCLRAEEPSAEALRCCLRPNEVDALIERCDEFLGDPVLPEMFPWRCVPWPLI